MFGRKKHIENPGAVLAQTVPRDGGSGTLFSRFEAQSRAERGLYSALREAVPVVDAAIDKIVRLVGDFRVITDDASAQAAADDFLSEVKVGGSDAGLRAFVYRYLDSLLTYGEAVGEMLPSAGGDCIAALYNASLDHVRITAGKSPMELSVCRRDSDGDKPAANPSLVLVSLLNQREGTARGTSILRGLPFVSSVLLRIFESLKTNWERVGDVRFAVTYSPKDGGFSRESAKQIADEWRKAMRSHTVCDFVAAGDVSVRVIGAESEMPDCEAPVRTILEQITAKLGIPPFLLGLSWSSTERMSKQQADILTSELEYYRAALEPVIKKIVRTHLRLSGHPCRISVEWNDINLQDAVELSQARLNNAQALKIERECEREAENEA